MPTGNNDFSRTVEARNKMVLQTERRKFMLDSLDTLNREVINYSKNLSQLFKMGCLKELPSQNFLKFITNFLKNIHKISRKGPY